MRRKSSKVSCDFPTISENLFSCLDQLSVLGLLLLQQGVFPQDSGGVEPDLRSFLWIFRHVRLELLIELQLADYPPFGLWFLFDFGAL